MNSLPVSRSSIGHEMRAACVLTAFLISSSVFAQPLPGQLDQKGHRASAPAASRPTDVPVTGWEGALSLTAVDSLELAAATLEVERAEVDVEATSTLQRLIPRITFSASFGVGEVIFRDPMSDAITILTRDSYRLTFALGLDQLLRSPDHDRALIHLKAAKVDLARMGIQNLQRQYIRLTEETATRQELALLADELKLVRQLVEYNETLFSEGKAEFDVLARAKLQLLNLSRVIHQASQRLARTN